jgi:L-ascorbate metabolism protein UlaG (beta-lactamase superfamily)
MEITSYGQTCLRLRSRDVAILTDPYPSVVGASGRGLSADIVTISRPDEHPLPEAKGPRSRNGLAVLPTSLANAFVLDGPGEYEIRDVLITGIRTFRDDARGERRGKQTAFLFELEGLRVIHLGDIGHLFTEERAADIGSVHIAFVPVGGALSATKAAELVAQLDARLVIPMSVTPDPQEGSQALARFLHEMGEEPMPQARLSVSLSGLPQETTTVLLEPRPRS